MITLERSTTLIDRKSGYFHFVLDLNLKWAFADSPVTSTKGDTHEGKEDLIKVSVEKEIEGFVFELEAQFKVFDFKTLEEAVEHRKKGGFKVAFKALQGTCRHSLGPVDVAAGLEASRDPIVFKVKRDVESHLGKGTIEGELHIGLTLEAWRKIAWRVSRSTLVRFLQEEGFTGVLNYLVSVGLIEITGALVGTVSLVALTIVVTTNERQMGHLNGLQTAYYAGYLKTIFADSGVEEVKTWQAPCQLTADERKIWTLLEEAGRNDARRHARLALEKIGEKYDAHDPEDAPVRLQRDLVVAFGSARAAYDRVNQELHQCAGPLLR